MATSYQFDENTVVHHKEGSLAERMNIREDRYKGKKRWINQRESTNRVQEARESVIKDYPILLKDYGEQAKQQSRAPPTNLSMDMRSGAMAQGIRRGKLSVQFVRPPLKSIPGQTTRRDLTQVITSEIKPQYSPRPQSTVMAVEHERNVFTRGRNWVSQQADRLAQRQQMTGSTLAGLGAFSLGAAIGTYDTVTGTGKLGYQAWRYGTGRANPAELKPLASMVGYAVTHPREVRARLIGQASRLTQPNIIGEVSGFYTGYKLVGKFGNLGINNLPKVMEPAIARGQYLKMRVKIAALKVTRPFRVAEPIPVTNVPFKPTFRSSPLPKRGMDYALVDPNAPGRPIFVRGKDYFKFVRRTAPRVRTTSPIGGLNIMRQNMLKAGRVDARLSAQVIREARASRKFLRKSAAQRTSVYREYYAERGVSIPSRPLSLWSIERKGRAFASGGMGKRGSLQLTRMELPKLNIRQRRPSRFRLDIKVGSKRYWGMGRTNPRVSIGGASENIVGGKSNMNFRFAVAQKRTQQNIPASVTTPKMDAVLAVAPITEAIPKARQGIKLQPRQAQKPMQIPALRFYPAQISMPRQIPRQPQGLTPQLPSVTVPTPRTPRLSGGGGKKKIPVSLGFDTKPRPSRKKKVQGLNLGKFKTGYSPSLTAYAFNIKGVKPGRRGISSGIVVRPII